MYIVQHIIKRADGCIDGQVATFIKSNAALKFYTEQRKQLKELSPVCFIENSTYCLHIEFKDGSEQRITLTRQDPFDLDKTDSEEVPLTPEECNLCKNSSKDLLLLHESL